MPRAALALPVFFLAAFYFWPLAEILRASLTPNGALDLSPFAEIARDPYYRDIFVFTVAQATASTLLTLGIGLPAAYVFARYEFRGKTALRALATAPFVMPVVVVSMAFGALIGPRGLVNSALMWAAHLDEPAIALQNTLALMLIAHVFYNFSLVLRIVGSFWSNLDPHVEQAAAMLGADRRRVLREVTLPLALPALGSAALLVFVFCFTAFGTVLLLAGPRYATIETEIYTQATSFLNLPIAAALSLIQMAVTLGLTALYTRLQARTASPLQHKPERAVQVPLAGRFAQITFVVVLGFIVIVIAAPLVALTLRAVGLTLELGLRPITALFELPSSGFFGVPPIEAVRNSLVFAVISTAIALVVGLPAAYAIAGASRTSRLFGGILDPLLMLPIGTSAVTLGLGYILAFARAPFDLRASPALVPLAHALLALPFVVRALVPALRSLDPRLREAAAMLGANSARVWREVDLPILARGLAVAATFAFTVSMGEFAASLLLVRPDFPTMPVVIYRYLGQPGLGNYAIALLMSGLLLAVSVAGFVFIERARAGRANMEF